MHFLVAVILIDAAHVLLDLLPDGPALRMPEHHAGRLVLQMEKVELAPELAMVALLRFLDAVQVSVEIVLSRPRGAVDPLQHFVARIAAPVRSCETRELEYLELAGRGDVRSAAKIGEPAFGVERDVFVGRDRRDDLRLVVLAEGLEVAHRVVARHQSARDRLIQARELRHLLLDRDKILGRERPLVGKIVIEPVLDHGADGHLRVGKQFLDGIGQEVRSRMADNLEAVGILVRDDGHARVPIDDVRSIDQPAVDLACQRSLGEARSDRGGHLRDSHWRVEMFDGAVG